MGALVSLLVVVYGGFMLVRTLVFGNPVAGYPSLLIIILFLGDAQLITLKSLANIWAPSGINALVTYKADSGDH
jgi:hypothetical protein